MIRAIFAGSFDPPTLGHLDIIVRSLNFCDECIMAIGTNSQKKTLFSKEERLNMMTQSVFETVPDLLLQKIQVRSYNGLLVDFAKDNNIKIIIRGVRNAADFDYENTLALINKKIAPEIETIFIPANPEYSVVSSSMVKELSKYNKDCSSFVSPTVNKMLKEINV